MAEREIKYRPILFSTPMVKAILEGRKSMTRRIVKYKKKIFNPEIGFTAFTDKGEFAVRGIHENGHYGESSFKMPFQKGMKLWVKETHYRYGKWIKNGTTKTSKQKYKFIPDKQFYETRYFDNPPHVVQKNKNRVLGWYKRNSLFMSRVDSRIILEITNIRVERLQQITSGDCYDEGILGDINDKGTFLYSGGRIDKFKTLWQSINGVESWEQNPFVWVISFRKLDK